VDLEWYALGMETYTEANTKAYKENIKTNTKIHH